MYAKQCWEMDPEPYTMTRLPPPPALGQLAPSSYVKYKPGDPNHDCYVQKIALNPPFGEPLPPHYICFDLDFGAHQHYVLGLCDDSTPPYRHTGGPWRQLLSSDLASPLTAPTTKHWGSLMQVIQEQRKST
jgi:hypothetical protein